MTKTLTVEGDITAVDTATALITQGSVTAPSLSIPAGVKKIDRILVAAAHGVGGAGSAIFLLRLGGTGVMKGEQAICFAGAGESTVQAGSDQAPSVCPPLVINDVDIEVAPGNTIRVQGEMMGTDIGTTEMVVTLYFA